MRSGRKSAAQTPAPKKDRIYGSKTNPKGSASSEKSAKSIVLSDKTMKSLQEKLKEFKEKHPAKKNITLNDLKAVYRRGLGAYSSTHRPTITGGVPNTRNAWAMARVNKFLLKAGGTKVKAAYVQDDDLMKYADGGELDEISKTIRDLVSEWNVSACEINKGECFVFADVLESKLRQKGYDAEFLSNDYFYNTASEEAKHDEVLWYNEKDYNSEKPENLIWEGYHAWVYVNGKHYDAETPDGVVNFYDLPIFKKKRYADGGELDNYSVAIKENGLQQPFEWNAYNSEETIYVPENEIYAFLYNAPNTKDKIDDDALIFSNNRGLGNFWQDLKTQKGSESLVAILKGRLSEDKTKLYILTMTTKNEFRKKGLMSKLIREVRSKYNIDKENVIFIGLTDMGQKMYNKKRYAEGGLIAPNGKPSNLTPEQHKLVRTPEFKAWFGDWENSPETASKVVDDNGEPLVVYHGTSSFFNIFKEEEKGSRGRLNEKFWSFTTNIQQALVYALDTSKYGGFSEPRILPVFLYIKDMPIYDNEGKFYRDLKVSAGYKDIDIFQLQDFHSRGFDMGVEFKEVDGFCVKNTIEMEKINSVENENELIGDTYYVRNSNQIKLADGTNTTFDAKNPDVRFAEGGELKEIKLPDLNMSYGALKKTLNYQGYDIEPMKQELQIGKVAKGMSVQQIAQHHNTTVDEIQKQLDKGIQVEMEHTDNEDIARAIALDHVYESPVYYDKLETIEKEFKDGGVVVGKRHSEYDENGSGEKFLVESTGQVVELEGGEGVLCQESMSSDKKFSFEGKSMTGREIASYLNHKYGGVEFAKGGEVKNIDKIKADMPHVCGCKHQYYHGGEVPTAVVRNLKGGEAVVTVKSMESKDQYNFNGKPMTPRQIFSQINMASGGKKFEDGGVINLQSIKDDARLEFDIQLAKMMYYVTTLKQMI